MIESTLESRTFHEMASAAETLLNPSLEKWKEGGGGIIGFFCSMIPEELFMAGGVTGFRMRATGSQGTDLADAYFTNLNCSFPRNCLNLALEGEFEFLDGIVCVNSCDHIRRLYDNWQRSVPTRFLEFMHLPRQSGPDQIAWYAKQFAVLRERLEEHFGVEIKDGDIRNAIRLANETRRLQRRLYELRKRKTPPITGAETLQVMVAGTAMPKEYYNTLLRELLEELDEREAVGEYRARLMITGGILDDPVWIQAIEEMGGLVVTDATCFGTRLMWLDIDEQADDPIGALARYYLDDRPSCPRLYDKPAVRSEFVADMYRDFECDGIIGEKMMFCDQWNVENYMLSNFLKKQGVPFLRVEREYITGGTGQLKTRVQAFIESMGK